MVRRDDRERKIYKVYYQSISTQVRDMEVVKESSGDRDEISEKNIE